QPPVEDLSGARARRIDQHDIGRRVGSRAERGITGRENLDDEANALADPTHLRERLGARELYRMQPDAPGDLDDVFGSLVAEHAGRQHGRGEAVSAVADGFR